MFFSIIIPTCNRNSQLAQCLEKLAPEQQTFPFDQYEVIVSDDGKDGPAKTFCNENFPWVRYNKGPERGPASNRNSGAKIAKGDWLVFTDDDCLPEPGWLQAYADAVRQNPDGKAFEGAILPDDWELLKKDMAECPVNATGGCFWSANIMVDKDLFKSIEGFDEQFLIASHEDKEIYNRLKDKTRIPFIESAIVIHPVRVLSLNYKLSKLPRSWKNYIKYVKKFDKQEQKVLIKKSIINHCYAFCSGMIHLKPKTTIYHLSSLLQYSRLIFSKL